MYKIFTVAGKYVEDGAEVVPFQLSGAGIAIPAITIGQQGRGRELGVLPVELRSTPMREEFEQKKRVVIVNAIIGTTKSGKPKLIVPDGEDTEDDKIIVVFRTGIGFRGGNSHTGDLTGYKTARIWDKEQKVPEYAPFPGQIIARGVIAQGAAGRMGSGEQLVALMPRGVVFRAGYSGRLYGRPSEYYYLWNGEQLLTATREERDASDIF